MHTADYRYFGIPSKSDFRVSPIMKITVMKGGRFREHAIDFETGSGSGHCPSLRRQAAPRIAY